MRSPLPSLLALVLLLGAGALRLPIESRVTGELHAEQLLPARLEVSTRERIGQTGAAATLGGLRTLVASSLNLRAYLRFTEKRWDELADLYDTIVNLAPHTLYYWESGAWHMAYNAVSSYRYQNDLPELRRRQLWQASFRRGREFMERGLRNNPDEPRLWMMLGDLLADPNKLPDYAAAAEAYRRAALCPEPPATAARFELYALAKVPDRSAEALELARRLYADRLNRTPTLNAVLFALECDAAPPASPAARAVEIFATPQLALRGLTNYRTRAGEGFPQHGVDDAIRDLESPDGTSR